jgi:hypothetical protein
MSGVNALPLRVNAPLTVEPRYSLKSRRIPWFLSGCAFITLIFGCGTGDPAKRDRSLVLKKLDGTMLTKAEANKAAANLAGLLPDAIDSFIAGEPPTVSNLPPEAMIAVERKYKSATLLPVSEGNVGQNRMKFATVLSAPL